jgi:hypothetical protein
MTDEDRRVEELLARGNPGGPRLDRLWERLEKDVVKAPARRPWWQAMALVFAPLSAAMAVWALGLVPVPANPGMQERGSGVVPPQLQGSCGPADTPCHVGQPIYLRLLARHVDGVVYVRTLLPDGKRQHVAGPLYVDPGNPQMLPVRLTPDASDVEKGLDVESVWVLNARDDVDQAPPDARSVLHLVVAP